MSPQNATALRAVPETLTAPSVPTGDPDLTRDTMASWREGQRRCRARKRHNWAPYTVYDHHTWYDVIEMCTHCRNRRSAEFSTAGRKLTRWQADYREGYLLPKGAARIDEDLHDELMLADILSRRMVEALDDDEER